MAGVSGRLRRNRRRADAAAAHAVGAGRAVDVGDALAGSAEGGVDAGPELLVATDASVRDGAGRVAWVDACGKYEVSAAPADVVAAELTAVALALRAVATRSRAGELAAPPAIAGDFGATDARDVAPARSATGAAAGTGGAAGVARRVRLLIDSKPALDLIRRAQSQGRPAPEPQRAALAAVLEALAATRAAGIHVRLEHVRAHRGHPLNEAAHTLAFCGAYQGGKI